MKDSERLARLSRRIAAGDARAAREALSILERENWSPLPRPLTYAEALGMASEDGRITVVVEVGQEDLGAYNGFKASILRAVFVQGELENAFDLRCRVLSVVGDRLIVEANVGILRDEAREDEDETGSFRVTGHLLLGFSSVVEAASEDSAIRQVLDNDNDLDLDWSDTSIDVTGVTNIDID